MQKIRSEYMTNPDFDPSIVAKASSAAEGLCKWIKAMEVYDRVEKVQCFWFCIHTSLFLETPYTHTHTHARILQLIPDPAWF